MQISDKGKQIARIVTFALIGGLLLYFLFASIAEGSYLSRIVSALAPFLIGAFIAFLLKPICNRFDILLGDWFVNKLFRGRINSGKTTEKRTRRKAEICSIMIAYLFMIILLVGILFLVIPSLWISVQELTKQFGEGSKVRQLINSIKIWFEGLDGSENIILQWIHDAYDSILGKFSTGEGNIFANLFKNFNFQGFLSGAASVIGFITSFLVGLLVTVISSIYILANRKRFSLQATMLTYAVFRKSAADWIVNEVKFANRKFSEFLAGKFLDSLIVGCILFILFTIFSIPQAPLIAVFMAFCNMIPFFGPFIGAIPCGFIVLMSSLESSPFDIVFFLVIVLVVQQLDGNILDPFIVGDSIGISSFWVLFAVIIFGDLFGFVGMLLGVPIFAVVYDIIRQLINFGLKKRSQEQLLTNYNFIFHDPNEEREARKKRAAAIKAARKEAREKEAAEREEAMAREVATAAAAAAARAEADAEATENAEPPAADAPDTSPLDDIDLDLDITPPTASDPTDDIPTDESKK